MNLDWPPTEALDSSDATYADYAEIYDALFDHLNAETGFYLDQAHQALGDEGSILEIGSGTGRLTRHLLAAGYTVAAVEPSEAMLARAEPRLAQFGAQYQPHHSDISRLALNERFGLAVAPYGMVAHLLSDEDRLRAFEQVYEHLAPGGFFIFDDMPGWLGDTADSRLLSERSSAIDPATGLNVRLLCNTMDVVEQPLSVRYDIIDWLVADKVARRSVIRVVFRNISLPDELELLRRAGFADVELFGDFTAKPFRADDLTANERLVVKCRKG
jgi:SAM-dependent methyltransferase